MKKIKLYYLKSKKWVLSKYYGSLYERFMILSVTFVILFLLILLTT